MESFVSFTCASDMPQSTIEGLYAEIENKGWAVVESPEGADAREALLSLRALFGSVVRHPSSGEEGLVAVDNAYRPSRGMLPHTDGTYYPVPPAIICLQCSIAAESGGVTTIIDAKDMYANLQPTHESDLNELYAPIVGVRRDDKYVESPVFSRASGKIHIRFRVDETIGINLKPEGVKGFNAIKEYVEDERHQLQFKLHPRQILIADNTRILHGRTAYDPAEERCMYRMHLDGAGTFRTLQTGFVM